MLKQAELRGIPMSSLRNQKGMAIGVARRGARRSGERALCIPP